jgi:hypothetical protein
VQPAPTRSITVINSYESAIDRVEIYALADQPGTKQDLGPLAPGAFAVGTLPYDSLGYVMRSHFSQPVTHFLDTTMNDEVLQELNFSVRLGLDMASPNYGTPDPTLMAPVLPPLTP